MHVHERGSGQPIVLVHGWGAGGVTWSEQLASLADEFRVLAPDLPGFGSTPPLPRSDAAGFATAIRRLVDDRGLREVVLVGWSMGGLVALGVYASRFACHALAGLAIVDVAPRARPAPDWDVEAGFGLKVDEWVRRWPDDRESVLREVTELAFSDPDLHRPEIEQLVSSALAADPDAAIEAFSNLLECDFRARPRGHRRTDAPGLRRRQHVDDGARLPDVGLGPSRSAAHRSSRTQGTP